MTKEELREQYLLIRKNIVDKKRKSLQITKKVIEHQLFQQARIIGIYQSLKHEVDTSSLITESIKLGKIVALPRVKNDNLEFYRYSLNDELEQSGFNILEPIPTIENYLSIDDLDLIIVPGICFDYEKNRIGFGKGYYDRYLSQADKPTIALCFAEQFMEENTIPSSDNDIKMKYVITNKRIY